MLDYNDDRLFDLPLQINTYSTRNKDDNKEDRPKQIQKDPYRLPPVGKENHIIPTHHPQAYVMEKYKKYDDFKSIPKTNNPPVSSGKKNRDQNLRNIIKRQLYSNQKASLMSGKAKRPVLIIQDGGKENKPINRYQQLLSQVYGDPKPKPKANPRINNLNAPPSAVKRHASVRSIPLKEDALQRYQSEVSLKREKSKEKVVHQEGSIRGGSRGGSPTYLQLFMQKRRPFLLL